jgi:hypothetical protein
VPANPWAIFAMLRDDGEPKLKKRIRGHSICHYCGPMPAIPKRWMEKNDAKVIAARASREDGPNTLKETT